MAYEMRQAFQDLPECQFFDGPRPGLNVWPHQGCPCFQARAWSYPPDPGRECWYCAFANFHLDRPVALDVGVCQYGEEREKESRYG